MDCKKMLPITLSCACVEPDFSDRIEEACRKPARGALTYGMARFQESFF